MLHKINPAISEINSDMIRTTGFYSIRLWIFDKVHRVREALPEQEGLVDLGMVANRDYFMVGFATDHDLTLEYSATFQSQ
jgi:hypothetical protein